MINYGCINYNRKQNFSTHKSYSGLGQLIWISPNDECHSTDLHTYSSFWSRIAISKIMFSQNNIIALQEYQKALEDADEKVNIATQTYDLVS